MFFEHYLVINVNKKAQLMLAYPRDAKTMKKIPDDIYFLYRRHSYQ